MKKVNAAVHTHLGRDGRFSSFDREVDRVSARLGEGGVWVISNCNDWRYEKFVDSKKGKYNRVEVMPQGNGVHVPEKDLLIVRGQEDFAGKNHDEHFLVFGHPKGKNVKDGRCLEDSLKEARDFGAVIASDHAFFRGAGKAVIENRDLLKYFSTWEIFNGFVGSFCGNKNTAALIFYNKVIKPGYDIGAFAGDDSHTCRYMAKNKTPIEKPDYSSSENLNRTLGQSLRSAKDTNLKTKPLVVDTGIHIAYHVWDRLKGQVFPSTWFADPGEYKSK